MRTREKKKIYMVLTGLLVSLFIANLAFSGPYAGNWRDGGDREARMEARWEAMAERLGLSDTQKDLLATHREKQWAESAELRTTLRETREALGAELGKTDFDQATVEQLHDQIKALKAEMADHRFEGILELRQILTPEQFSQFMAFKEEHRGHKGKKCGAGYRTDQ